MPGYNGTDGIPGLPGEPGAHGKRGKRGQLLYTQKNMENPSIMHMNEYSQKGPLKENVLLSNLFPKIWLLSIAFIIHSGKGEGNFIPLQSHSRNQRLWDLPLNKAELMITADWLLCSESTRAHRHSKSAIQQINDVETEWNSLNRGGEITRKHLNTFYDDSIL